MIKYESSFTPPNRIEDMLRGGKIIGEGESPSDMISRVAIAIGEQEAQFSGHDKARVFTEDLGQALDRGEIVMSTPIMTNAGRELDRPLTACVVPTSSLERANWDQLRREVIELHEQGMGTGFNLDATEDPIATLEYLNRVAVESANSGREDRPVGNMAVLSVYHPAIDRFIKAKVDAPTTGADWKFNISVNLDSAFMNAVDNGDMVTLANGERRHARQIFEKISGAAAVCADPGILFLDRMNSRNPLPALGAYETTAPCAEVGLVSGETCQFGYINLGEFVQEKDGIAVVNYQRLETITLLLTRALDNCLEISQSYFADPTIQDIARQKRKIGIGLCGVADALSRTGLPYDSPEARELMQDILSFINFASKKASVQLAQERGSFEAMEITEGNRHLEIPGHIERLYGDKETNTVAAEDWRKLSRYVQESGSLRNVSTIALPPTGRSALAVDASTGIEPHFDTFKANSKTLEALTAILQSRYGAVLLDPTTHSPKIAEILASAHAVDPLGHVAMAAALQEFTDEALSKTVNLPAGSTAEQVADIYHRGYEAGMSGVTVYVDGTHAAQPKAVK